MSRFIDERKNVWQRLETLLKLLDTSTLRRLNREEVRELGHSYRRAASDLAIARAEARDPRLVSYLNSLVIRAHGRIYRAESGGGARLKQFFAATFPQTFRRTIRYTALAFIVFWAFFAAGFIGTRYDSEFSELAGVDAVSREKILNEKPRWWKGLNDANQVGASSILTNNIGVTFFAFAYGALLGVGTLLVMASNGASIGAVLALTYNAGYGRELLTFMCAHGVIELSCIFIAGGAGLLIGSALLLPGDLSRMDALKVRGLDAMRLIAGCVPLLVIAGIIEGFISPAPIAAMAKVSVAIVTGIALYSYLFLVGRGNVDANLLATTITAAPGK